MRRDPSLADLLRQPRVRRWLLWVAALILVLILFLGVWYGYSRTHHQPSVLSPMPEAIWREEGHQEPYVPQRAGREEPFPVWPQNQPMNLPKRDREAVWERVRSGQSEQKALAGMLVFLDAGHGGYDPGAVWTDPGTQVELMEKTPALAISQAIATSLRQLGAEVIELRTEDQFVSLGSRTAAVGQTLLERYLREMGSLLTSNQYQALQALEPKLRWIQEQNLDAKSGILGGIGTTEEARLLLAVEKQFPEALLLSVHLNMTDNPEVHGTQVYLLRNYLVYQRQNTSTFPPAPAPYEWVDQAEVTYPIYVDYDDRARGHLAVSIYEAVSETLPHMCTSRGSGSVLDENFFLLRTCNLPSILLETGFMSHPADRDYLFGNRAPGDFAQAVSKGLVRYVQTLEIREESEK